MKKGLLIWNILLTLGVVFLAYQYFSSKKGENADNVSSSAEPAKPFAIAYFEMDSVEANFNMVKDVKAVLTKKETSMMAELNNLEKSIQNKYNFYQGKAVKGEMTQEDSDKATLDIKGLQDQFVQREMTLKQQLADYTSTQMKEIKTTIENYLKEYNKDKKYDYIVSYEQGLFYYRDTVNNITSDLIKGLNANYKKTDK